MLDPVALKTHKKLSRYLSSSSVKSIRCLSKGGKLQGALEDVELGTVELPAIRENPHSMEARTGVNDNC